MIIATQHGQATPEGKRSSTYTVSADGKTMTEAGSAANSTEKTRVIYDKQ